MIKGLEIKKNANLEMIRALAIIFVLYAHIGFFCIGNFAIEPWLGYILGGTGQVNTSSDFSVFGYLTQIH